MTRDTFAPFRITVCGLSELDAHCARGVSHVLSILDPGLPPPPAFGAYGEHARLDLRFDDVIETFPGRVAPEETHVEQVLAFGRDLLDEARSGRDAHLLVHCHMGVSRSTASMTLILAMARPDRPPEEALAEVVRIRPQTWPNLRMIEMGDRQLDLGGRLVEAARARYRDYGLANPEHARLMREWGRGREVAHFDLP